MTDERNIPSAPGWDRAEGMPASASALSAEEIDRGLARLDPLTVRPRTSSRVLCVLLAVVFAAAAGGVWWLGVCTENGQAYDDMVFVFFRDEAVPPWLAALIRPLVLGWVSVALSAAFIVAAAVILSVRRRWWALGQTVALVALCAGSGPLKGWLPRPHLINVESSAANSAPSGHMLLALAAGFALLLAVSRAWRAAAASLATIYAALTGLSLMYGQWHRPADVVMSALIAAAWAMLVLATTRTSGMDEPGTRLSSPSVQIAASALVTVGVMAVLYGAYLIWQVEPGLALSEQWARRGAHVAAVAIVVGLCAAVCGSVLALRQITASPLSKVGLVGAPPTPPQR